VISVIVPTRNAAGTIDACLDSLAAQNFRDFELCIVDAQSSDDTVARIDARRSAIGREVRVISEPDRSVYDAMNKGIASSGGEWLYFLGADDALFDADVLGDMAREMRTNDADVLYGDVIFRDSGERYSGEFTLERLLFDRNICHQAIFYRRSVLEQHGGYSRRYPIWADWELNIRLFRHPSLRARWVDRTIALYQPRSGVSRAEDPVFSKELPALLNNQLANLREERLALAKELAAVRRQLSDITSSPWYQAYRKISRWLR